MASVLDSSGASARMIADQLGHSRVSMSLDFYLGGKSADPRVLAALEAADASRFLPQSDGPKRWVRSSGQPLRRYLYWSESRRGDSNP